MIKPQDLRIDNEVHYVTDNEQDIRVRYIIDISEIDYLIKEPEKFNEVYKPIAITPEILQECGMDKPLKFDGGEIEVLNNRLYIFSEDSYAFNQGVPIELKGFHHLQNIVYYLIGIELTLRNPCEPTPLK